MGSQEARQESQGSRHVHWRAGDGGWRGRLVGAFEEGGVASVCVEGKYHTISRKGEEGGGL